MLTKTTNGTATDANAIDLNINIKEIKLNTRMCPPVMLANKRIINANGLEKIPIISTGIINGNIQTGTCGLKICAQFG